MKKITKMLMLTILMFGFTFAVVSADSKTVPDGGSVTLSYGSASANDTRTDHSYNFQTKGKCNNISNAVVSVYVKDGSGVTKSSDSCMSGGSCEATWFSSSKVSHVHVASSALYK